MATASVLCPAQEHHGSQRPAVNLGRAADYAWRLLLQPLRRKACFVASVADARRLSMASRSLAVPPCFNAGVNRISRCSAALLCSHWLSSASAFATPARRYVLAMLLCWRQPHLALQCCTSVQSLAIFGVGFRRVRSMRLCHMLLCWHQPHLVLRCCTSVQSLVIFGVGFVPSRCSIDVALRHASMLASPIVSRVALLSTSVQGRLAPDSTSRRHRHTQHRHEARTRAQCRALEALVWCGEVWVFTGPRAATRATQQNLHRGTTCGNPSGPPPSHSGQKRVALLPLSGIPCGTHPL